MSKYFKCDCDVVSSLYFILKFAYQNSYDHTS